MQSEQPSVQETHDVRVQSGREQQEPAASPVKTTADQQPTAQEENAALLAGIGAKDTGDSRKLGVPDKEPSSAEDEAQAMQTDNQ